MVGIMLDFIDFSTVRFSNNVRVLNATPHPISFLDGNELVIVQPSGATLKAAPQEEIVDSYGQADLVKTIFAPSPEGEEELKTIQRGAPNCLVIGSIISAQAYPGRVVAMTPAPGHERVPPAEKRMSIWKFTIFK